MLSIEIPVTHKNCIMCGSRSLLKFDFNFIQSNDDGSEIVTDVFVKDLWEGYSSIIHGGITASLIDSAMTHCLFHKGIEAVTAELTIRYLKPIKIHTKLRLFARLESSIGSLFKVSSKIYCEDILMARATAKFMKSHVQK